MNEDLELMMSEIPANTTMDDVDDTLSHSGKKGMHWGTRLYQNLDGSLTPLGRLHYGIGFKNIGQVEAAKRAKEKAKKEKEENERKAAVEKATRSGKAEDIYRLRESMTDDELYRAVTRMQSTQKLESVLASIENERFSALNRETKQAKEPKKSIFEKAREKKAEKEAKEKADAEAKKQQAMEALSKGMAVLDTVTKTTNSIVGAYQSYNKMASMINSIGGDKLPSQLPTWDTEPWKKPNDGKTDKGEKQEQQEGEKQEQQEPADNKQSNEKSWTAKDVKGLYSTGGSYSTDKSKFSYGSTWSTSDKQIADSGYSTIMSVLESSGGSKSYTPSAADYTDIDDYLEKAMRGESVRFFHSEEEDPEADVLCHYGRKEQKWGVRRYQNLDGSLTEEGRIRYSKARKKYGMDDPNLSDRKRAKQLTLASDMLRSNRKALSTLEHPSDNELRRTIETSVNPYLHPSTLASAYGGAMVGGPIGAAVAGSIKANRVQADVANKVVMGREILDRYMKDPEYYSKSMYAVPLIDQRYINEGRGFIEKLSKSGSLRHSGIKGMKWGIRRFQNLDGSLTEAGKERYQKKRSEYGLDRDPSELTKAQRSKQIGAAYRYAIEQRHTDDLDLFDDNDLRRLSEADYKKGKAYEMGSRVVASALAGVGGLVISGGNPAAGLASASATFALNTARSAIRDASGTRAADYTNDLVIGREALNKLMENPDVYNFDMEKALGNYERSVQRGMAWDYKSGRGK